MSNINDLVLESLIEEINVWTNPNRKLNLSDPNAPWSGGTISPGLQQQFNQYTKTAKEAAYNNNNFNANQLFNSRRVLPAGKNFDPTRQQHTELIGIYPGANLLRSRSNYGNLNGNQRMV